MPELTHLNCTELQNVSAMSLEEINDHLHQLDSGWHLDNSTSNIVIKCEFKFQNYYQTMAFVNVVAQVAHQQDHHPHLSIDYSRCVIEYSTHSVSGISLKDFVCAAKINAAHTL